MSGVATAAALLDAAEVEFAESGIEDASLRAIMRAARADSGAIHYHFKTREALAEAVLDRILVPLNDRRLRLLEEAAAGSDGGEIELPDLLGALIRPDVEAACTLEARSAGRGRLIGAIYIRPADFVQARVQERFRPVADAFLPHLVTALPEVPTEVISWRVRWCLFGTLGALLSDEHEPFAVEPEALIRRLVETFAGALAGPAR